MFLFPHEQDTWIPVHIAPDNDETHAPRAYASQNTFLSISTSKQLGDDHQHHHNHDQET
jgi:hypothetical protein